MKGVFFAVKKALGGVALILLLGSCMLSGGGEGIGTEEFPVVGGSTEYGYPLAGMLAADYGGGSLSAFCSATAVTPTVVMTAGHCLDVFYELGGTPVAFAMLNPDGTGAVKRVNASTLTAHPNWSYDYTADLGLVALSEPIDATKFPQLRRTPMGSGDIGSDLLLVGYGATHYSGGGVGTKRSIHMSVTETYGAYYVMLASSYSSGVCYGDSGGPTFDPGVQRDIQVGIHARTQIETCGPAEDTDVGQFYDSFIRPTVLSLDPDAGACGDGVCTGIEDDGSCPADCGLYVCGDGTVEVPEVCDDGNLMDGDGCSSSCLSNEACGNGIVDAGRGEVCDDGNAVGGDGCAADCLSNETCGNGIVDSGRGEVCDDGNAAGGDGCAADCRSDETCGNGVVDTARGEACDDGNLMDGDGCSNDCLSNETCGNGIVDSGRGEVCDDGNAVSGDGCSADCRVNEACGNGVLEIAAGEVCDDGNTASGDGCSADCRSNETCGNGVVDVLRGEVCDDGNVRDGDGCSSDCRTNTACGNGVVEAERGEACDDGNAVGGDGCSADCRSNETCGNGITDFSVGEICDDGNTAGADACAADCRSVEGCGNGVLETARGEVCDDGNSVGGDGCAADCRSDETCGNGFLDKTLGEICDDGNVLEGDACPANCGVPTDYLFVGGCGCRTAGGDPRAPISAILLAAGLLLFFRRLRSPGPAPRR